MITYPLNNIEYSAEDAELFHVTRTSGVYANNSFDYSLLGGNDIEIGIGIAWIKNSEFAGKVVAEKKSTVINMGITDAVYPRIDAIVIQFNAETNETTFVVKQGTPATSPIAPEVVRTSNIYELHLYHILRPAGAVSLSAANITDMRLSPEHCGIMADSVTSVDTKAIQQQINAFIENTSTRLDALANETEQRYIDVNGDINNLIVDTQTRLDDIVADTDGKISEEVTSQLTEAKESGDFKGDPGDDYILTEADKTEIGAQVKSSLKASDIGAGTFAGQVIANASGQSPSVSCVRNSKLVSAETNPTIEGEFCWTYE